MRHIHQIAQGVAGDCGEAVDLRDRPRTVAAVKEAKRELALQGDSGQGVAEKVVNVARDPETFAPNGELGQFSLGFAQFANDHDESSRAVEAASSHQENRRWV